MARKSKHGLSPGIQLDRHGVYWATLAGDDADLWRARHPGTRPPRRKAKSPKDALRLQRNLIDELRAGRDPNADNPQVAAYVAKWIAQRQSIKPSTRRRYEQSLRWQIEPLPIGRLKLRQLTRAHVRMWVAQLVDQPRHGDTTRTLDPYSVRNALAVLRAALGTAVRDGLLPVNVAAGTELPPPDDDEIRPLTRDEVTALLDLVNTYNNGRPHRNAALYHVAIRCGLRQGEILGLRWSDLNLDAGELQVSGQWQRGERTHGKSRRAHRTLPLTPDLVEVLRTHQQNQLEEQHISGPDWNAAGLVFVSENGTPLSPSNTWRSFQALQRRAGLCDPCETCGGVGRTGRGKRATVCAACAGHGVIARYRFHDLRHTYAALSLAAGNDLFTVSRRMGHSSSAVTADKYGHLYRGEDGDAHALDRYLKRA